MTDTKISGLADLGTSPDSGDLVPVVDVSDTSMAPTGTNKKVSFSNFLLNYVAKALFDAHTILMAISDNTPVALTVGEQTVVGRATGGNISALAIDSDLSSVSGTDNTVPSAKATKTALDGKSDTGHTHDHGTLTGLGDDDHTQYLLADGSRNLVKLDLTDSSELTIATGAITVTQSYHRVDTESNAATDDLDTINGGSDGMVLYLVAENDARTVVLRHGIGNIVTPDGANFSLDTDDKVAHLIYSSAITAWRLVAATGAGGGASTALDNLASVAINTSLISDTDITDSLGSSAIKWLRGFFKSLVVETQSTPTEPASGDLELYADTTNKSPRFINDDSVLYGATLVRNGNTNYVEFPRPVSRPAVSGSATAIVASNNAVKVYLIELISPLALVNVVMNCIAGNSAGRIAGVGIYDLSGARLNYATFDCTAAGVKTSAWNTANMILDPGYYYYAVTCNNSAVTTVVYAVNAATALDALMNANNVLIGTSSSSSASGVPPSPLGTLSGSAQTFMITMIEG